MRHLSSQMAQKKVSALRGWEEMEQKRERGREREYNTEWCEQADEGGRKRGHVLEAEN